MVPEDDSLSGSRRVITLLTDFGLSDAYVGVMKGVILSRAPSASIVDLTHEVAPQAITQGAFLLETALRQAQDAAWRFFPAASVHLAVVDPGVGTPRRRLALSAGGHYFVGPDNGVLSAALPASTRGSRRPGESYESRTVSLTAEVIAVAIENEALLLRPVSATFEARDAFAPAAAHLAAGGALADLGPRVHEAKALPAFRAPVLGEGLEGRVIHVDRFGNLITDILVGDLPSQPAFSVAGRRLRLAETYAAASGLAAIVGSSGFVEVALTMGSAAAVLGLGPGDRVKVTGNR